MGSSQEGTVWQLSAGKLKSATEGLWNALGKQGAQVAVQLEENARFRERAARYLIETAPADHGFAGAVLEQDLIAPAAVAQAIGVVYTDDQRQHFMDTLPTKAMIYKIYGGRNFMLVAGPPVSLSLSDIIFRYPIDFHQETVRDHWLYSRGNVGPEWIALRKTEVPGSLCASWDDAYARLLKGEYVPNAAQVAWCAVVYKEVRNVTLLPEVCVRTSSADMRTKRCISVGDSAFGGIQVHERLMDTLGNGVGLASALIL
ncbi:MAG: hypothetical protein HYS45_00510 [Parcubacteria group bacterium]|nr:hypothetical protein [Parcubacteria group bacterium]